MKTNWKYTDADNRIVYRTNEDGSSESCLASALVPEGATIEPADPPDYASEKQAVLTKMRTIRDTILMRLNGIQLDSEDAAVIAATRTAKQGLLDITGHTTVQAATGGAETEAAIKAVYQGLVADLYAAAPYAVTAFRGFES